MIADAPPRPPAITAACKLRSQCFSTAGTKHAAGNVLRGVEKMRSTVAAQSRSRRSDILKRGLTAVAAAAYKAVSRAGVVHFTELLLLEYPPARATWRIAPGYAIEPLEDLSQFHLDSATPYSMLEPAMANRLNDGRNDCFVARKNGALAGYVWFARRFIEASHNRGTGKHSGLAIQFPTTLMFLYKAWVVPEHRGQGLFGALVGSSFETLAVHGISGILTTTEVINQPVLSTCRKLGFEGLGRSFRFGIGPLYCGISPHRTAWRRGVTLGSRPSVPSSSCSQSSASSC